MAVILNEDTPLVVTLKDAPKLSVNVPGGVDYIPGYRDAEEQRRANEEERIANEIEREAYYEDFRQRAENGEFDGVDGTVSFEELTEEQRESLRGPKGDTGNPGKDGEHGKSGVYVGNEVPTDDSNVWITLDEEPEEYATKQYVNEMLGVIENGSY